ncbi:MAG TPA: HD domain-containing protein [Nitrospirae bacterium]|nr:HD domain-containing protein [Nitrospirota bacterium]
MGLTIRIDPVCKMDVSGLNDPETTVYKKNPYFFCSEKCRDRFLNDPDLFISETKKPTGIYCKACRTETYDGFYIKDNGPYCCEKCYFRDRFLGGVLEKMEGIYLATIEAFVKAIDAREHEVGDHSYRVTQFAMILSRKIGITGRDLVDIYCGSLLHDIGKIGIPDSILLKQGKLSEEETSIMAQHPETGYRIINHIGYLSRVADIIHSHHELYDGSGYPRGLKGTEITLGARIFAVCDTLDALTVDRPYRKAIPFKEAKEYITSVSGTRFDPRVVDEFLRAEDDLEEFVAKIMI